MTRRAACKPTPVFFHGMEPGEEVSIDIERGKTLIVKFLTVGEPHADGTRAVFWKAGRPAARGGGAGPVADRQGGGAAEGVAGRPPASRRADAGAGGARAAGAGGLGGGGAEAVYAGGDEDGDDPLRRPGRRRSRGAGARRDADAGGGFADPVS